MVRIAAVIELSRGRMKPAALRAVRSQSRDPCRQPPPVWAGRYLKAPLRASGGEAFAGSARVPVVAETDGRLHTAPAPPRCWRFDVISRLSVGTALVSWGVDPNWDPTSGNVAPGLRVRAIIGAGTRQGSPVQARPRDLLVVGAGNLPSARSWTWLAPRDWSRAVLGGG